MQERPTEGLKHLNRIQSETAAGGKDVFREYWIHEWDGTGYELNEHVKDIEQAITRALELGYTDDAEKLAQFKPSDV